MLHNHHARNICRQAAQHFQSCLSSAGRRSQTDNHIGRRYAHFKRQRRNPIVGCNRPQRRTAHPRTRSDNDFIGQRFDKPVVSFSSIRLSHKIHRTNCHCIKNTQIQRRNQNNRNWMNRQDFLDKINAVHPRHFYIQRHNIRIEDRELFAGVHCVERLPYHFNIGISRQAILDDTTRKH